MRSVQGRKGETGTRIAAGDGKSPSANATSRAAKAAKRKLRVPKRQPDGRTLFGRSVSLVPLVAVRHARELFDAFGTGDPDGRLWTFLPVGPFVEFALFHEWISSCANARDPVFYAIIPRATMQASGMAAYCSIEPEHGVVEIGDVVLAPSLQDTRAATEALFILIRHAIEDLGYGRVVWTCDADNRDARAAAERLGFVLEGVQRRRRVVKGESRDMASFSLLAEEWPERRKVFLSWLADENFTSTGRQKCSLSKAMARR